MTGANDDVADAGASEVRGEPTEHLRFTSDFWRAAAETPGGLVMPDAAPRRWFRGRPRPTAPERVPVELWELGRAPDVVLPTGLLTNAS